MYPFKSASSTKRFKIGTVLIECDGARIVKVAQGKWAEYFTDGTVEEYSFPARQIAFPARLATTNEK